MFTAGSCCARPVALRPPAKRADAGQVVVHARGLEPQRFEEIFSERLDVQRSDLHRVEGLTRALAEPGLERAHADRVSTYGCGAAVLLT